MYLITCKMQLTMQSFCNHASIIATASWIAIFWVPVLGGGGTLISNGYGCKAHTSKGWAFGENTVAKNEGSLGEKPNFGSKLEGIGWECYFWAFSERFNPLNPAGRFSGLRKQGPRNPAGRFSGICYGVSKTRRAFKPAHVRLIIKWFVYTGRYHATLRSQVESSSLFSFLTICNLLMGFCTRYTNLRRKYGRDTQCMWRYRYSLHVMDNVEELYTQKIGFWDRNGGIHGTC